MKETQAGASVKDKDIDDVKVLIGVKDSMESIFLQNDQTTLVLDQLDESLKFLAGNGINKEKEAKQTKKLFDEWASLKKLAKEVKKEIAKKVDDQSKTNKFAIDNHENALKDFHNLMKKRDFYRYETGCEQALASLQSINAEIEEFIAQTEDLKYNAVKFEHPNLIEPSQVKIGEIQNEVSLMQALWDHTNEC